MHSIYLLNIKPKSTSARHQKPRINSTYTNLPLPQFHFLASQESYFIDTITVTGAPLLQDSLQATYKSYTIRIPQPTWQATTEYLDFAQRRHSSLRAGSEPKALYADWGMLLSRPDKHDSELVILHKRELSGARLGPPFISCLTMGQSHINTPCPA